MNIYDAVMNIETGAVSEEEYIASMQHLINTGLVWRLQGSFGRRAVEMIEAGVCYAPDLNNVEENTNV
jgi:hypothetical protein